MDWMALVGHLLLQLLLIDGQKAEEGALGRDSQVPQVRFPNPLYEVKSVGDPD